MAVVAVGRRWRWRWRVGVREVPRVSSTRSVWRRRRRVCVLVASLLYRAREGTRDRATHSIDGARTTAKWAAAAVAMWLLWWW